MARVVGGKHRLHRASTSEEVYRKHVLLRVVPVREPRRIVLGQVNVVDADKHTGGQGRQDVEEERDDIRIHEHPMRSVEEDNVAGSKLGKNRQVGVLKGTPQDLVAKLIDRPPRRGVD